MLFSYAPRPLFHFTPVKGWMNDPNGLVYAHGEYHLFYQYEPDSMVCTCVMDWGHAVSRDLVNWSHLPVAITHDSAGFAWSGSAILDSSNHSGFGTVENPPLLIMYTQHRNLPDNKWTEQQALAFSLDRGRTWTKYAENPVIDNPGNPDFRDPKIFWHTPSAHWIVTIASQFRACFYKSRDLKTWQACGHFDSPPSGDGRFWECPDLFPLCVDGTGVEKWVLIHNTLGAPNKGSGTRYHLGHFNGDTFVSDPETDLPLWLDFGPDNYAGITWDNAPDNRRILIGWMNNWEYANMVPALGWRGALTVPRDLSLKDTPLGLRLFQQPVRELESLRQKPVLLRPVRINGVSPLPDQSEGFEIELTFDLANSTATELGLEIANARGEKVRIGFNKDRNCFIIDRKESGQLDFNEKYAKATRPFAPRASTAPLLHLRMLIDVTSVELFADQGQTCMTAVFFPNENFTKAALYAENGAADFSGGKAWQLGAIKFTQA